MGVTAGIINGTDLLVYSGNNVLTHSTSCSLSLSMDLRDASTKASSGWKAVLPGQRSWQVESQGMVALDASYNYNYFLGLILNKTRVSLKFKTASLDDYYYNGYAYLTSVSCDAPNQGNTTYSASFVGDGALIYNSNNSGGITWSEPPGDSSPLEYGTYYELTTASDLIVPLPPINQNREPIVIKCSNAAGSIEIQAPTGYLVDGHSSIYLTNGLFTTIIASDDTFEAIGTHLDVEP